MKDQSGYSSGFGWSQGITTPQPHVNIPSGTYEEEFGRRGFFGKTSHLYHRHPPTGWLRVEGPLKPRAYQLTNFSFNLKNRTFSETEWMLENSDVRLGFVKFQKAAGFTAPHFFRNGDGDEVRFIHSGKGKLWTDFGKISYQTGDYLVIPRGTTFTFETQENEEQHLVIQSHSEIELPEKGMLGRHALFDPMVMKIPELQPEQAQAGKNAQGEFELRIQREGQITKVFYPNSPIDIAGWKGDLSPWGLSVSDIRPVVSPRFHLPPSVHTTFLGRNFVICSFLPRPLESEEGAMKVPFYHRNIDFDEVLFYHAGNFFSREGIKAGAITWHPQGIHHGPHPNAAKNAEDKTFTEEIAVMLDTRHPLKPTSGATSVEFSEYYMSWKADQIR